MGDDGVTETYWRVFYNLITPQPNTLWLSDTYTALAIIGRIEEKEMRIIA